MKMHVCLSIVIWRAFNWYKHNFIYIPAMINKIKWRNKKPITTMYLVFLYDKYFLSYRKISYFFSAFQKTRQKTHLFCDYSKSNCRIAKPSTWLKSAFDSGKNEYNIIKIREIFISTFCPILTFWGRDDCSHIFWKMVPLVSSIFGCPTFSWLTREHLKRLCDLWSELSRPEENDKVLHLQLLIRQISKYDAKDFCHLLRKCLAITMGAMYHSL